MSKSRKQSIRFKMPKEISTALEILEKHGFNAYAVGGCVRDVLRGKEPQDWDVAADATPEEIQKIFPDSFYENAFGTVTVKTGSKSKALEEIEITTFRIEGPYSDKRHPDHISFAKTIDEDLARRDFTINALAMALDGSITDPHNGKKDLKYKIIRAVGNPEERFTEDALRMMRAVRFAITDEFSIEPTTFQAIQKHAVLLQVIAHERMRDEFIKIIMSKEARHGIDLLRESGLLRFVIPELEFCYGVSQNKHHIYDVYEHCVRSLDFAAKKGFKLQVRLAALFHDIGKPQAKKGEGPDATFYGHEIIGAKIAAKMLDRLRFSKQDIEHISKLVRYHLFYYNVGEVNESSVRRLVRQVGPEHMNDLLEVRMADRIGSGVPKAEPYKLRHLRYIIEKVSQDPISVKSLKINGNDVMEILGIKPGPKVGQVLDILVGEVLDDPKKNVREFLFSRVQELGAKDDAELENLSKSAQALRQEIEMKRDEMTKQKYWVT